LRDEEILAALGYEPVGFTTAADALAACQSRPERFDAVIVVLCGPDAGALEFTAALRAIALDRPIVFAAGSADDVVAEKLAAAGASEVIHRPLNSAEIASALMCCLAPPRHMALQHAERGSAALRT
jgi:PleD family two-component response regulator